MPRGPNDYIPHTIWSDPGGYRTALQDAPGNLVELADHIDGFLIHHAVARSLGFGVPQAAETDRNLRTVHRLLETAFRRDHRPLNEARKLPEYLYGTCHDFALLSVSVLRSRGVPARLRAGFADYFRSDRWEDHWVCEYHDGGRWKLFDAQLGYRARDALKLPFSTDDLPRDRFVTAPALWRKIRKGEIDAARCGVSFALIEGSWFVAASVLRDAAALTRIEALPWDYWGPARQFAETRTVGEEWLERLDALAAALGPAPDDSASANKILRVHTWARPTALVLSARRDGFVEARLDAKD